MNPWGGAFASPQFFFLRCNVSVFAAMASSPQGQAVMAEAANAAVGAALALVNGLGNVRDARRFRTRALGSYRAALGSVPAQHLPSILLMMRDAMTFRGGIRSSYGPTWSSADAYPGTAIQANFDGSATRFGPLNSSDWPGMSRSARGRKGGGKDLEEARGAGELDELWSFYSVIEADGRANGLRYDLAAIRAGLLVREFYRMGGLNSV